MRLCGKLIIATLLTTASLGLSSFTAYAESLPAGAEEYEKTYVEYNGGENISYSAATSVSPSGFNVNNQGYRIYMVNASGTIIKDSSGTPYVTDLRFGSTYKVTEGSFTTRLGANNQYAKVVTAAEAGLTDMPRAIVSSGSGFATNGNNLYSWLSSNNYVTTVNVIRNVFDTFSGGGQAALDLFNDEEDNHLIIEPIWWGGVFSSYKPQKTIKIQKNVTVKIRHEKHLRLGTLDICCEPNPFKLVANKLGYPVKWYENITKPVTQTVSVPATNYSSNEFASAGSGSLSQYTGCYFYGTAYEWLSKLSQYNSDGGFLVTIKYLALNSLVLNNSFAGLSASITDFPKNGTIGSAVGVGYGMHAIASAKTGGSSGTPINTYDGGSKTPAKSETPTPAKKNTGKVSIVKTYINYYIGSNQIEDVGTYVTEKTSNKIAFTDETAATGYRLAYYIGVTGGANTSYTGSQWVTYNPYSNTLDYTSGFKPQTVVMQGSAVSTVANPVKLPDNVNTIYIVYVKTRDYLTTKSPTPPGGTENPTGDKTGPLTIVKVYGEQNTYDLSVKNIKTFSTTSSTRNVYIAAESGYNLIEWRVTNNQSANTSYEASEWCNGNNTDYHMTDGFDYKATKLETTANVFNFTLGSKPVLYILYLKGTDPTYKSDKLTISESHLTQRFNLAGKSIEYTSYSEGKNTIYKSESIGKHSFIIKSGTFGSNYSLQDNKYNLTIQENYLSNGVHESTGIVKGWSGAVNYNALTLAEYTKEATRTAVGSKRYVFNGLDYILNLYRVTDNISMASWKNKGNLVLNVVHNLGLLGGTFKSSDGLLMLRSGSLNDYKFHINIYNNSNGIKGCDLTTSASNGGSTVYDTATFISGSAIKIDQTVATSTYVGTVDGGKNNVKVTETPIVIQGDSLVSSGIMLPTNKSVSFLPYIKMQADTKNIVGIPVNVIANYKRTITPNEYAGVYFNKATTVNSLVNSSGNKSVGTAGKLIVGSNQWSMHATATNKFGSSCVLPGGAIMNLQIPIENRQTVTVETYNEVLAGSGLTQVVKTGGDTGGFTDSLSADDLQAHNNLVANVASSLDTLNVQEWVADYEVGDNLSAVWSKLGSKAVEANSETDSKYYFRDSDDSDVNTKNASNSGDLDVNIDSTKTVYYTFFSNANGDIYCKKDADLNTASNINSETDGELVLAKGKNISSINSDYVAINTKTLIVEKIKDALETNTGNDKSASWASSDGKWYNEAFDGLTIAVTKTEVGVGFVNTFERTSVLDPILTPPNSGKEDYFSKAKISQFKLKTYCEIYKADEDKEKKVGMYKGKTINMQSMDELFTSDIFFIPNVNVQDLK